MNDLACYAKIIGMSAKKIEFASALKEAIAGSRLKKKDIADEAGIHPTSLSRILAGESVARNTAIAIVEAINKLANREVVSISVIELAGFSPIPGTESYDAKVKELSLALAEKMQASGINDLEDEEERERVFDDLGEIAKSMIARAIERQERRGRRRGAAS